MASELRQTRIRSVFNVRLPVELAKRLRELAEERKILPRDLLEEIVRQFVTDPSRVSVAEWKR